MSAAGTATSGFNICCLLETFWQYEKSESSDFELLPAVRAAAVWMVVPFLPPMDRHGSAHVWVRRCDLADLLHLI